jgi:glycosyltransferase involved in cell wall biosynthesis
MKVLLNATTLVRGGAVQVAVATIREVLRDPASNRWEFAVSAIVLENLQRIEEVPVERFHVFASSPARSSSERMRLRNIERSVAPDAVFTVFGPAYVRFLAPHLLGCAMPWVTHPTQLAMQTIPTLLGRLGRCVRTWYAGYWLRQADAWVTESQTSRRGMQVRLGIPAASIGVVANTCAQHYLEQPGEASFPATDDPLRMLCFSASYPHKCLDLIPDVANVLLKRWPDRSFEFVLTLPTNDSAWQRIQSRCQELGVARHVRNIGTVSIVDGPALYRSCHLSFQPTVLETFSATYPESMAMGLPIVTSNLDFARDICGSSAIYFAPRNALAAADAIGDLLRDPQRWQQLIDSGRQQLSSFPTPEQKYTAYRKLIELLISGRNFPDPCIPASVSAVSSG